MGRETVLGMVLSTSPIGESDKRLVLLTREKGKISAFARGASKPNSPLLGCGQTFAFGEFHLYVGRNSYTVQSALVKEYFTELRNDLETLYYGFYFCEMADYFSRENLDAEETLKLLYQSLKALIKESIPNELVRYIYEWKQMVINGEAPNVSHCQICKKTEDLTVFSKRRHGTLCGDCYEAAKNKEDATSILASTVYTLQFITNASIQTLFTFTVTTRVIQDLKRLVTTYMMEQYNYRFHSLEQLNQLEQMGMGVHEEE